MLYIKRILFAADFSPSADAAFEVALEWAKRREAELHVLHVTPTFGDDPLHGAYEVSVDEEGFYRALWEKADERLRTLIRSHPVGTVPIKRILSRGTRVAPVILDYAAANNIDLILVGTHGRRGVRRFYLGSVAEAVVRSAPCHVFTIPAPEEEEASPHSIRRILVPIDFTPSAPQVVSVARDLASFYGASLDLVHAIEPFPFPVSLHEPVTPYDLVPDLITKARARMEDMLHDGSGGRVQADLHVVDGRAAVALLDFAVAQAVDLIVMLPHREILKGRPFLGSTTERIVRTAPCAVFTVHTEKQVGSPREALVGHQSES